MRIVRRGNVLQHPLRRNRPCVLRNHGVRKDAGRGRGAARQVVRLACHNLIAELLGQSVGEIRAAHEAAQLIPGRSCRQIGEITGAIGIGRHSDDAGVDTLRLPGSLVIEEEEELVAANRAAEGAAELVLPEGAARRREIIARIEIGIAQELEGVAVKFIGSGFGDNADLAAAVLAILRVEVAGDDAELRDRVEIGNHGCAGVDVLFDVAAVHAEVVGRLALPVDGLVAGVERAGRIENRGAHVLHRRIGDRRLGSDAGLQRKKIRIAASVERNRGHLPAGDDLPELRAGGFNMQRVVGNRHALRDVADLKRSIESERSVRVENNLLALILPKSGSLDVELIVADRQNREGVVALAVGVSLVGKSGTRSLSR